jgi:hypothetical protein
MELNKTNNKKQKKEDTMKRLLALLTVLIVMIIGCSNNDSITSPVSSNIKQLSTGELTLSKLPMRFASVSQVIDGNEGGLFLINQEIMSTEGRVVKVDAQFEIPMGAFTGSQNISIRVDVDNGCIYFLPHMNFNLPCYLNYSLQNMNLSNLGFLASDKRTDFCYFDDFGIVSPIPNMGVSLNFNKGNLQVKKANLTHFSRYGFIRKDD